MDYGFDPVTGYPWVNDPVPTPTPVPAPPPPTSTQSGLPQTPPALQGNNPWAAPLPAAAPQPRQPNGAAAAGSPPSLSPPPGDGGGLPSADLSYGDRGGDTKRLTDEMWERDRTRSPAGQPKRVEIERRQADSKPKTDALGEALTKATGLPYSMPEDRPQAGPPAQGAALPVLPTPATRMTGSSGRPSATASVEAGNRLNIVQQKAADWFGIDTPEERARAKTYLAHWAAGMANSTNGIGAFADANLAGLKGVQEEEVRQAGLDLKREEMDMRREQTAYERTRDERNDARDAKLDGLRMTKGGLEIASLQEAAEARRREQEIARNDPFSVLNGADDPATYSARLFQIYLASGMDPAAAKQQADEMTRIKFKVKDDPLAGL